MSRPFDQSGSHKEQTHTRNSSDRDGHASEIEKENGRESNRSPLATSHLVLDHAISQADGAA